MLGNLVAPKRQDSSNGLTPNALNSKRRESFNENLSVGDKTPKDSNGSRTPYIT
jgi:hypothetical protein